MVICAASIRNLLVPIGRHPNSGHPSHLKAGTYVDGIFPAMKVTVVAMENVLAFHQVRTKARKKCILPNAWLDNSYPNSLQPRIYVIRTWEARHTWHRPLLALTISGRSSAPMSRPQSRQDYWGICGVRQGTRTDDNDWRLSTACRVRDTHTDVNVLIVLPCTHRQSMVGTVIHPGPGRAEPEPRRNTSTDDEGTSLRHTPVE